MIQINLDLVMAQKRISAGRLAELIDLTPANLSILKNIEPRQYVFQHLMPFVGNWTASPAIFLNISQMKPRRNKHGNTITRTDDGTTLPSF